MPTFVPGLELNARFYEEIVGPLLSSWRHSAARLGPGSEVLGFDSERSIDHGWGPRLTVFIEDEFVEETRRAVNEGLPDTFQGWPVQYGWDETPVAHHVTVTTLAEWMAGQLGVDPTQGLSAIDWLLIPQQKLLEVTRGAVYRDDPGTLGRVREQLRWYPTDVWRWMLGCQWRRIAQEEAFVARTAEAGDEIGSRLVTARLARELMRLWFLLAQTYWPYAKWFGSAFAQLSDSESLGNALLTALAAGDVALREEALTSAYELVARRHNDVGLTDPVDPAARNFHGRPYRVLMADRFVEACHAQVEDPALARLPLVGSIDQFVDSTDVLSYPDRARRLLDFFG